MDVVQQYLMDQVLNELDKIKSNATKWLSEYSFIFDDMFTSKSVQSPVQEPKISSRP